MHYVIEVDERCPSCGGTGIYVGLAERDGAGVVCYHCKGTGCHKLHVEYDDFEAREPRTDVKHVVEANPGIVIGRGKSGREFDLPDFGGQPYEDWAAGKPFPPGSEMRAFTCPAWWYQIADYNRKPEWEECWESFGGTFSSCPRFANKDACWRRWDKEYTIPSATQPSGGEETCASV